jgi:hypothetical protein
LAIEDPNLSPAPPAGMMATVFICYYPKKHKPGKQSSRAYLPNVFLSGLKR